MKFRNLGTSGLKVSEIALGTMTFGVQCDETTSFAIMDRAAAGGVNLIDTADCYPVPLTLETAGQTEEIIGRWLRGKRDRFAVATKCFFPMGPGRDDRGNSRIHILQAADASLRRLQTDYIDLYQVHAFDHETPLEETLRALDDLIRCGKIRHAGCSNFMAWELSKAGLAASRLGVPGFESLQPRYNLLHREIESDLLPLCRDQGLGVIVFNPLAGGMLTGKYPPGFDPQKSTRFSDTMGSTGPAYRARYWQEESIHGVARLRELFDSRGKAMPSVAVAWVLAQPGISAAIVGASRPDQLDATLAASDVVLEDDEKAALGDLWFELPRRRPASGPVR